MEILLMEKWMEGVFLNGKMAAFMKEIIKITRRMDSESILTKTGKLIKADGKMVTGKAKELSLMNSGSLLKGNGTMVNSTEITATNNKLFYTTIILMTKNEIVKYKAFNF
jgi:hypothetical protein